MKKNSILFVIFFLIIFIPGELFMSEIHFEFIPLEDLIKLSDAILIVKKKELYEQI